MSTAPKRRSTETRYGRIPVSDVQPVVEGGAFPAKAVVGQDVRVSATAFREGHDSVGATAVLYAPDGSISQAAQMTPGAPGSDAWHGLLRPESTGTWSFAVEAWDDPYGTWHHAAAVKIAAGVEAELMLAEGAKLFAEAAAALRSGDERPAADELASPDAVRGDADLYEAVARILADTTLVVGERLEAAESPTLRAALAERPIRRFVTSSDRFDLLVERELAGRGGWYEFFPRSEGAVYDDAAGRFVPGTFATAQRRLPAVAAMGFEILYLPPIHPIGRTHRKGPNNTLTASEHDPGSPWAIGSAAGGHDAIHPDLGTEADFARFVARAEDLGLEVALDLALQASPDHPWATEHPEWFTERVDGTIAYAENPPKKYQDIYPLNFDNDPEGLGNEILRIVRLWIDRGVKIFRVDNPHTKPVAFWEWLIGAVGEEHPDVVFLAEAFTRPAMMHALGKAGFQQSYTYFTWRNTKTELEEYFTEVSRESIAFFRPNFWVNTPDILPEFLQFGGPAAFKLRAVLAAMSSPLWGVYSGYELCEHVARPGSGEYIDSEKFEYRPRDFAAAEAAGTSLAPYLARLNQIRHSHPALDDLANLELHSATDDSTIVFSKSKRRSPGDAASADTIVVVVNLDPHGTRESTITLNLEALDLTPSLIGDDGKFEVEDLLSGQTWRWGEHNYVRLDPHVEPAHILHLRRPSS
ncbi:alpha-1,4-glucan--maltose-1-phosphate maltosyltransferase [Zhihengliuella salsuginis]|uniref:Alpha-1,4-glucan:maltose-1-phosphate maltosyltransferase n=1 Tax=Zhihengliuella salsuginis TaxID=578222 RepID=A0ABQ3GKN2_9MICC|nr:alpha-1,4-glucan--maltose-1-phosphate maltosyltransferase [Zhihengliuella salsuginis]GHD12821.1 alpha-1,4-glucan:maltose-1-phosphate maltosyltransferase 2 [Zhihengliuella salsuginis]